MEPIITSMLDTDLYLLTMQNAICRCYPRALAKYQFVDRGKAGFHPNMAVELKKQINHLSKLQLIGQEKEFLKSVCYYLPPTYIDFLSGYRFNPDEVGINQDGGELSIDIVGPFYRTILWEVPLMAIISELGFMLNGIKPTLDVESIASEKATKLSKMGIKWADFGTRRRFSKVVHENVVRQMKTFAPNNFFGTSCVSLAEKFNLTPIGTMAHAYISFHAAKYGYRMANEMAMNSWLEVFNGDLGVCLPDSFTTDVFLQSFTTKYAKLFDGCRQDSGVPIEIADKIISHYKKLRIPPETKTIVFSDNLNSYQKIQDIVDWHKNLPETDRPKISFGIGTWLSNHTGAKPYNMVIKLVGAKPNGLDWVSTCKLSDDKGKHTGPQEAIDLCKRVLNINA